MPTILAPSLAERSEASATPWIRMMVPLRESNFLVRTLLGHRDQVYDVALSSDGRLAVSASYDSTLKVWDVGKGCELHTLKEGFGWVVGVVLSADGRVAISRSGGATLKVWDVEAGHELCTLTGHRDQVQDIALSADGLLAVSASVDKTLIVWDVMMGRMLRVLKGHRGQVNHVALSADGKLAISSGISDVGFKVWDVAMGAEMRTIKKNGDLKWSANDTISCIALSPDGKLAVSVYTDRTIKVWDMETGCELRTFKGPNTLVRNLVLSANGRISVLVEDFKDYRNGYGNGPRIADTGAWQLCTWRGFECRRSIGRLRIFR